MDEASGRSVLLVAALAYALPTALPAAAALTLIPVAETWRGRIYGVAALCLLGRVADWVNRVEAGAAGAAAPVQ